MDEYMSTPRETNAALTMLVAGTLTIASKCVQREYGMDATTERAPKSHIDVSRLAQPKTFNVSCKKVQRGTEEELRNVYDEIFSLWEDLDPVGGVKSMRYQVEEMAGALGRGELPKAENAMVVLCRSVRLSSVTTNTMKQLVEQMHRAIVRYRCSRCKNMGEFKSCVRNACEVVAHSV
jgi:hypothetical protein